MRALGHNLAPAALQTIMSTYDVDTSGSIMLDTTSKQNNRMKKSED